VKTPDWTLPRVRMAGEREATSKPFLADRMTLGGPKASAHLGSSDITMERERQEPGSGSSARHRYSTVNYRF